MEVVYSPKLNDTNAIEDTLLTEEGLEMDEDDNIIKKETFGKQRKFTRQVPMPAVGHTMEFPRRDNIYKNKESLPFDEAHSKVWKDRKANEVNEVIKEWFVYILIGVIVGTIAFWMGQLEEHLIEWCSALTNHLIEADKTNIAPPLLWYIGCCGFYGMIAGLLTTYYGPAATGSGVAELIGYLNGVNYPGFIQMRTLITKILGVSFGVAGRLCVGKEGPLAHIGAICGASALYVPGIDLNFMKNDETKRLLIACGASCGVSAAFGAPIGGALFCYELSSPNTFWKFTMIWRVFFTCCFGNFILAIWGSLFSGNYTDWSGANIKFGSFTDTTNVNILHILPGAIIVGTIGGLLGALFINVNTRVNKLRGIVLKRGYLKVIETMLFCMVTACFTIVIPYLMQTCLINEEDDVNQPSYKQVEYFRGWCEAGYYDPLATIFWASEGHIIKNILGDHVAPSLAQISVFFVFWYLFTITTYGTNVPAGLFLPGMILGCAIGEMYTLMIKDLGIIKGDDYNEIRKNMIVLSIAAMMSGYTRMTYSLGIILMETAQTLNMFVPIIFSIMISNQVGYLFTRSLYERAVRGKQMPILVDEVPGPCQKLLASKIMSKNVVTLDRVASLKDVRDALKAGHHSFPVVNSKGHVIGLIPSNFLIVIVRNKSFYHNMKDHQSLDEINFE